MRSIRPGDRGPAVEDIQRRLLALGYDLGRTGVDGVFLGRTADAVRAFQSTNGLPEDDVVGEQTWSALVDATFRLGDRTLYLRLPHLHGADVEVLQGALNALGFACGAADGVFGAFTESGVREFQRNSGLPVDGIVGSETVRALTNLRHVWTGKDATAHSAARTGPARAGALLATVPLAIKGADERAQRIAERVSNLAHATTADALTTLAAVDSDSHEARFVLCLSAQDGHVVVSGRPVVAYAPTDSLPSRLRTAVSSVAQRGEIVIDLTDECMEGEHDEQRCAVILLDALCYAIEDATTPC